MSSNNYITGIHGKQRMRFRYGGRVGFFGEGGESDSPHFLFIPKIKKT